MARPVTAQPAIMLISAEIPMTYASTTTSCPDRYISAATARVDTTIDTNDPARTTAHRTAIPLCGVSLRTSTVRMVTSAVAANVVPAISRTS